MARTDRWSAVGLAVVAVVYLAAGREYPLDTLAAPGPGVVPRAAGVALLALAAWQLLAPGRRPPSTASAPAAPAAPTDRARPGSPLVMAGLLLLYVAAWPALGFVAASSGFVFLAARLMGLRGWWRPAALALSVAVSSHVIFATWLGVPLP